MTQSTFLKCITLAYLLDIVDFYIIGTNLVTAGIRSIPSLADHGVGVTSRPDQLIILFFQNLRPRSSREFNFLLKVKLKKKKLNSTSRVVSRLVVINFERSLLRALDLTNFLKTTIQLKLSQRLKYGLLEFSPASFCALYLQPSSYTFIHK